MSCVIYKSCSLFIKCPSSAFTPCGCAKDTVEQIMLCYRHQFVQCWNSELSRASSKSGSAGNKLRTYRMFKSHFQLETYLLQVKVAKFRIALTKLRVSCHKLQIEMGRYHKPASIPPDQRLCELCQNKEDELHFLCVCPAYEEQREELFMAVCVNYPTFIYLNTTDNCKFIFLLEPTNTVVVNCLAKFVYIAFKLHNLPYTDT